MLTAETLVSTGIGCKFTMTGKNDIARSNTVPGFGPRVREYSGAIFGNRADNVLSLEKAACPSRTAPSSAMPTTK
jgi:hypothetical protein